MQIPVKAAAGRLVRHPHTMQPLPTEGGDEEPAMIDDTDLHWDRLLRDGDLVRVKAEPAKAPKAAAPSKDDPA